MTLIKEVFQKRRNYQTKKDEFVKDYDRIIVIKQRAMGNPETGTAWNETASFDKNTPIKDIIEWAKDTDGTVIINIDESTVKK